MRPGDFVSVEITTPILSNVAVVPREAVGDQGRILAIGDDGRLSELPVKVIGSSNDALIIGDPPFGTAYVAARLPQLGAGIKVEIVEPLPEEAIASELPLREGS